MINLEYTLLVGSILVSQQIVGELCIVFFLGTILMYTIRDGGSKRMTW